MLLRADARVGDARLERREHHGGRGRAVRARSTCRSPEQTVTVLAATGSVGRRVVRLLAREGANVRVASRQLARAQQVCDEVRTVVPDAQLEAWETRDEDSLARCARRTRPL